MKMKEDILTVFPTELAKRRHESQTVLETGAIDTSRLITQARLMALCERAARRVGLLSGRMPNVTETRLLLEAAARNTAYSRNQPLATLSTAAQAGVLAHALQQFAVFSEEEKPLLQWLLAHETDHKLHGIGQLLTSWRSLCTQRNLADRFTLNTALLRLIKSGELPQELTGEIHFEAVRWLNPFEERFTAALKTRLGPEHVLLISTLPPVHAETAEDRLGVIVRSELERGNEEEWQAWFEDFADAFEADDSNILQSTSKDHISFFTSAHPYGEIEDVARRIARNIENGASPSSIAVVLRDLSPYTDIIPDVFKRFGIPYYFRRGTPAAAHPPVKALLALLSFPQTLSRDRLCDLLQIPGINWPGITPEARQKLVQTIRKKEPPRLFHLPKEVAKYFQPLEFFDRIEFILEQHGLALPEEVLRLIQELQTAAEPPLPAKQMLSLFEELLDNVTLPDDDSTESGVWIVNPMDISGLRFDSVFIAGMDDRSFPQIPTTDSLLQRTERDALRAFLKERKIACPRLALSEIGEALIQEEILFLTAMSAAREQLTLSFTLTDADGKTRAPGEFFERMRDLTHPEAPAYGESFHTILPPEACRAEDEMRQTQAKLSALPIPPPQFPAEKIKPLISQWLKKNPEFSATGLESLARNRFVFFLEKVLGIRPDRTHEDTTDPMDRGTLIHDILEQIYTAIAAQSDWYAKKSSTGWTLAQTGEIPLAVFEPSREAELLNLAQCIANEEFKRAEQRSSRHLGHPAVWETEKRKLLQIIENVIRMDIKTAQAEKRYPALFEMKFEQPQSPLDLQHDGQIVHVKGKIDRIDLIFDGSGELERLLVVDYKSKSKTDTPETIAKKTALNLDCQLALYTFAAQQHFFGAHNTPELNEKVQAVYHLQERSLNTMSNHFKKRRLTMTEELADSFLATLFSNVGKFHDGDLAAEPLIAGYEDFSHICRTQAIDPKELLTNSPLN